jgi:uracil-DNA glycosylase
LTIDHRAAATDLHNLVAEIRACTICAAKLADGVRPVLRISPMARICVAGQAPGRRVHSSGTPYDDRSGDRLREWLGISRDEFYDESRFAIVPMGFCFPGNTRSGADKPPRPECVRHWHDRLFAAGPKFELVLAIGSYAQHYHLNGRVRKTVTETVQAWRDYGPFAIPLPHPSWHNNNWFKNNPWFHCELVPLLRDRVAQILSRKS